MQSYHRRLGRGFNWLGGATVIAKVIDFSTILVMLLYLTKQQVGIASLVVSFGMIIEALNGLGIGDALIQARSVTRLQLDTVFWYVVAAALSVGTLTVLSAPWIERAYGVPGVAAYLLVIAVKQPLVGAALVPLAIMNRGLQYGRIAGVNLFATLAAALTRLALAALGAGAWALVVGYAASGLYILLGALLACPFRPGLRLQLPTIRPLMRFGTRAVTANLAEQLFKNIDYLLIGWFYGPPVLAVYRVAFDVAMEPAMAVGTLVTRTALPVFARLAAVKQQLGQIVTWSLRRIVILVAPLMVGLMLVADPLTMLLHDPRGNSYAAAAVPLKLLAAAALLRVTTQLLTAVMMGTGRPGMAARLSLTTLLSLGIGILLVGFTLPARSGIIAVSAIWLGIYPILLLWGARYLRLHWSIPAGELALAFRLPLAGIGVMVLAIELALHLAGGSGPRSQVGVISLIMALTYGGLFLRERYRPDRTA